MIIFLGWIPLWTIWIFVLCLPSWRIITIWISLSPDHSPFVYSSERSYCEVQCPWNCTQWVLCILKQTAGMNLCQLLVPCSGGTVIKGMYTDWNINQDNPIPLCAHFHYKRMYLSHWSDMSQRRVWSNGKVPSGPHICTLFVVWSKTHGPS